ncbi:hypothetical protein PEBR_06946 [Penicillium brasilianum]|uniref:BTB domain-containing protein n=1 Tax=Penicillium brasilianum TaxID=104259 RepID=A0A1S9RXJ0_PENBI|nr:hypothetical protein PEBR_06946 [Penicillium brasilianum]
MRGGRGCQPKSTRKKFNRTESNSPARRTFLKGHSALFIFLPPAVLQSASTFVISPSRRRLRQFEFLEFPGEEAVKAHNPDFLAHAKIYTFATRYLVDSLREQCLKSLHRDLCEFTLNARNMSHFLDLLQYTFEHTGRQEPGGFSSLRRVVIDYTSCKAKYLVKSARFRQILDMFGEIGSDLVAKLVQ